MPKQRYDFYYSHQQRHATPPWSGENDFDYGTAEFKGKEYTQFVKHGHDPVYYTDIEFVGSGYEEDVIYK